jgi:hypothetical protein
MVWIRSAIDCLPCLIDFIGLNSIIYCPVHDGSYNGSNNGTHIRGGSDVAEPDCLSMDEWDDNILDNKGCRMNLYPTVDREKGSPVLLVYQLEIQFKRKGVGDVLLGKEPELVSKEPKTLDLAFPCLEFGFVRFHVSIL